jgi:sulfate transport system permease protein
MTAAVYGVRRDRSTPVLAGTASIWLSVIVLLPLAAVVWQSAKGGRSGFWAAITTTAALESFRVTLTVAIGVTCVNAVFGLLVAWVLIRDDFAGKRLMDAVIDQSAEHDLDEVVIGMPHRGRLNVLANIVGKPYSQIFS